MFVLSPNADPQHSYDVTDKTTTNIISRVGYDGASYTHQGWVTDKQWQTTLVLVSKPAPGALNIIFIARFEMLLWT